MAAMFVALATSALAACPSKNIPLTRLSGLTPFALYSFTDGEDNINQQISTAADLGSPGLGPLTLNTGASYLKTSTGIQIKNGAPGFPVTFPHLDPTSVPAPFSIEIWFTGSSAGPLFAHGNISINTTSTIGKFSFLLSYTQDQTTGDYYAAATAGSPGVSLGAARNNLHHAILLFTGTQLKLCVDVDVDNVCTPGTAAINPSLWSRTREFQLAPQFRVGDSWSGTIHMMSFWNSNIQTSAYELRSCGLPNSRPYTPSYKYHVGGDVITTISLCASPPTGRTNYWSPSLGTWPYNDPIVEAGDSTCLDFDGDPVTFKIIQMPTKFRVFDVQDINGNWVAVVPNQALHAAAGIVTLRYQPLYGQNSWFWTSSGWQKNTFDSFKYQGDDASSARSLSEVGTVSLIVDLAFHRPVAVSQPMQMYPGDVAKPVYMDSLSIDLSSASYPDTTVLSANWSKLTSFPRWGTLTGAAVNGPIAPRQLQYSVNISMAVQAAKLNPGQDILAYDVFNYVPCYRDSTFTSNVGGNLPGIVLVCGDEANVTVEVMNFLQVGFAEVQVLEHAVSAITPSARTTDLVNTDFDIVIEGLPIYGKLLLFDGTPAVIGSKIPNTARFKYNNTGGYGHDDSFLFHIERMYGADLMISRTGVQRLKVLEQNVPPTMGTPKLTMLTNPNFYKGTPTEFTQPFTLAQSSSIQLAIPINDTNTPATQQEFSITLQVSGNVAVVTVENQATLNLGTLTGYNAPNNAVKSGFTCTLDICQKALSYVRITGTKYGSTQLHITINDNSLLPGPPSGFFDSETWAPGSTAAVEYDIELQVTVTTAPPAPAAQFTPLEKVGIYTAVGIFPACCIGLAVAMCWKKQKQHKASKKKIETNYIVSLDDDGKKQQAKPAAVEL